MLFSRVGEGRCSRAIFSPNHLSPRKNGYLSPFLIRGKNGYIVEFPPGKMSSPFDNNNNNNNNNNSNNNNNNE
jgi:hypothetical protein